MDDIDVLEDLLILKVIASRQRHGNQEIFKTRNNHGFYSSGVHVLAKKNPEQFIESTRFTYEQFKVLLNLVEPYLRKYSHRIPIEAEQRLYITLHYLAHGGPVRVLSIKFRIGLATARSIVLETCDVLWRVLESHYMSPPTDAEWKQISEDFWNVTKLPHCLGAIYGKHVPIKAPPNVRAKYFNKQLKSIILLAACDTSYTFTFVDVDEDGDERDGGVFKNSQFRNMILDKSMDATNLPNSDIVFPYYFVADVAFPLERNIMKPYETVSDVSEEVFNQRLCWAIMRIETAFDLLTSRWKVLSRPISFSPENAKKIVLATIVLHNFLTSGNVNHTDAEKTNNHNLTSVNRHDLLTSNTSSQLALNLRNELCEYLNSSLV
ncbi:uncharacterized protein LOC105225634 [Bactrocera dorsalis]|uniref:Uncharacterized protein LOC105225634 n=1 Tax=Bactrocera dorsalis TaxID=27457 RepID=A0A6I9UWR2_BACDO|nr:uncharacterized protein LOC105225634 [Bactrocera dorsalis]